MLHFLPVILYNSPVIRSEPLRTLWVSIFPTN